MGERKPNGYYKDFRNVKRELEPIIKELGHFPVSKEIKKRGLSTLLNYVASYYGGLSKVRKVMGYRVNKTPPRYWADFESIRNELMPIIKKLGHFPTQIDLRNMDKSGLAFAIHKYHRGTNEVSKKLGYEPNIKPQGYWCDYKNIERELEKVIEKIGHFPTYEELSRRHLLSLASAISKHGGFFKISEKMGYRVKRKPINYWKKWDNVKRELESVIKIEGHFPTHEEFIENKQSSIITALAKYFGGINRIRKKLGYELNKRSNGYYKDFKNLKRELQPFIDELGHFPTQKEFCKMGMSRLSTASRIYYGGLNKVRERLGYELLKKPNGYWKDWRKVKRELKIVVKRLGYFPTFGEFIKLDKSLVYGIREYHGGLENVRRELGFKLIKKSKAYWKDFSNVKKELMLIANKLGHFPTTTELGKNGRRGLMTGISEYYGGFNRVREKLGYESVRKPDGYWQNIGNVKRDLKNIIKEFGHFPSQREFCEKNLSSLYAAIQHHGGIRYLRDKLNLPPVNRSKKYWSNINNIKKELKPIIQKLGHFPVQRDLKEIGKSSLWFAIYRYHGGYNKVRDLMGFEISKKSNYYWRDFENVKKELMPIIGKLGHFPSQSDLVKNNSSNLIHGLSKYHGGLNKVRELMSYPSTNNHKIRTEKSLVDLLDNDEKARRVVERFGGDIGDVADILAVVYEGRLSQEDAAKLVARPSVGAYLGRFRRPIGGIGELAEISNELLPHDKNQVIEGILYRKVNEYIYQKCGPYPSKEKRQALLNEFELELGKIGGNGNG